MHRLAFAVLCLGSVAYAQLPPEPAPVPTPAPTGDQPVAPPALTPPRPEPGPHPIPPIVESVTVLEKHDEPAKTEVVVEGYLQPQFRVRQDSSVKDDTNGFRFARVRPIIRATTPLPGGFTFGAAFEVEIQPTFQMIDAFAGITKKFAHDGLFTLDMGQMRVPISRQQLLSDSRIAFIDKAQIATIAPKRDLGARITFVPPQLRQIKVIAGVFNGEGPNQIENINQKYLYAGRLQLNVLGKEGPIAEGSWGDAFLTVSGSVGYNKPAAGERTEIVKYYGVDVEGAWKGLSGTFEWLEVPHTFVREDTSTPSDMERDYKQNGFTAQLNYMLPAELPPGGGSRLEIGARVEEIDRNDTIPIVSPGEPEQSQRIITGVLTYYVRKHSLKVQVTLSHYEEIEDETSTFADATYDNDQAMLQLTYRMD